MSRTARLAALFALVLGPGCSGPAASDCPTECGEGFVCLETLCVQVCVTDTDCPAALSCVTGACLSVNHECAADGDCVPPSPCLTASCRGGLCEDDIAWPPGDTRVQPICPFEGDDPNGNNLLDSGETWQGVCTHRGDCVGCTEDAQCDDGDPCSTEACVQNLCVVDKHAICGGTCRPCLEGEACTTGTDCPSAVCDVTCQAPACPDGAKNQDETDIDCGGRDCPACADGGGCRIDDDCAGHVCDSLRCAFVACLPEEQLPCGSDVGTCALGHEDCERGQWGTCVDAVDPVAEVCDALDNDCDGIVDMGCPCTPGAWLSETVDTYSDTGTYASLAAAPDGSLHAAYFLNAGNDLGYAYHPPAGFWETRTVDSDSDVGQYSAIAVDKRGGAHIAYYDVTSASLKYAFRDAGGTFATNIIDAYGTVGQYVSIAVDSQNGVHVAYYDASNHDLKYAYKNGVVPWLPQPLDSTNDVGQHTSIAIDAQDGVHIAYYLVTSGDLRYIHKAAGAGWDLAEPVDTSASVGQYASLAIDSGGRPHIVYYNASTNDLRHAVRQPAGGWTPEDIDGVTPTTSVGTYSSLAIDASDTLHVAYSDDGNNDLRYATKGPSDLSWTCITVDGDTPATNLGHFTSIKVDDFGGVHISYRDVSYNDLRYAYRAPGAGWITSVVDSAGNVGQYSSLGVDPTGGVHISYYDSDNGDLRYAYRQHGGVWQATDADPSADTVAQGAGIAVDAAGGAHIAYYDATRTSLWYLHRSATGVFDPPVEVDNSASVGQYPSIAVDSSGGVHIAYYDATATDLKYAERDSSGTWAPITADSSPNNVGQFTSIGVDALGGVHVVYYDATTTDLKYAYRPPGTSFIASTVDQANDRGRYAHLAVEPSGVVHACYYDTTARSLRYGRRSLQGLWTLTAVDDTYADDLGEAGEYCSIAVTPGGLPRLAYAKNGYVGVDGIGNPIHRYLLRFAEGQADGSFLLRDVDNRADALGTHTSIAILPSGAISILYYDIDAQDLRHLYRCPN